MATKKTKPSITKTDKNGYAMKKNTSTLLKKYGKACK